MTRLPTPGSDNGAWGTILNDFLMQAHQPDGQVKEGVITAAQLADGAVTVAALDPAVQVMVDAAAPAADPVFTGSVTVPTPVNPADAATKDYVDTVVSAGGADATSSAKGVIQLAGDLSGTASSPTVPGLASKADTATVNSALSGKEPIITSGTVGQYWRGDKTWQNLPDTPVVSVNAQTGAVVLSKNDVGLDSVDNTSDATKNSAVATLTNKTLTSPVINNPSGFLTGAAKITVGTSAPVSPSVGDIWIDTN